MAQQLESPLNGFGAGLCLHLPGCCPVGSICSMATPAAFPLPAPARPSASRGLGEAADMQARGMVSSIQRERSKLAAAADGAVRSATATYPQGTVLGLSMNGSLRRFLEKRAVRIRQASGSPYSLTAEKLRSTCHR